MSYPLDDLRIVDLSRAVPGPTCTMLLSDMGAAVVMVEPLTVECARSSAPPPTGQAREVAARDPLRRNKRSIRIDLKRTEGQAVLHRLAAAADVFVEGFRPGTTRRLGCDYATLAANNPRLVYCSISGYGQYGPYAQLAGHDVNYVAMAGALSAIGRPGAPPAIPLQLLGDVAGGGLMAAFSILVALHARERSGTGQYIDVAMSDGVLSLLTRTAGQLLAGGAVPHPGEHRLTGALPWYDVYACADGRYLSLGSLEPVFYARLCAALDVPELAQLDETSAPERLAQARATLRRRFLDKTRDQWFAILRAVDACVAPVLALDEALVDAHHRARDMIVELPDDELGAIPHIGVAPKLSDTPGAPRAPGREPGTDTHAVLQELGFAEETIADLRAAGVVS